MKNIRYLEKKMSLNIDLYSLKNGSYELERRARVPDEDRQEKTINIAKEKYPQSPKDPIENFNIVFDEKQLPQPYKCSILSTCLFETDRNTPRKNMFQIK